MAKSFIGPFERSVLKALDLQRAERARRREICVWLDRVERCTHQAGYTDSGCGSPAYLLVSGSPRCQTHAIHDLIDLLLAKEVKSNGVP